ncbi:tRNA pseudouridine(13) synthase TruD [Litchfieldella rifensis]|uniref:tRNA pseudouridine synthase D n=1 Tax=Litchfieldella rifensis TaxID=762643 RepID=A0ABV7LQU7_9GAMM
MGGPPCSGDYRATPEDFRVEECLGFSPEGEGEHLWLWVEKRDLTTLELARRLARACEVSLRDIGYSGMKDRVAVTRQWLSVHLPGRAAPQDLVSRLAETPVTLLEQVRHPRKLKRGVHRANRFTLRLTGEVVRDPAVEERWQWLCEHGVPNYFGPQRFGPAGRNLVKARAVLARGWRKRDDREGMLLSTARSYLFNTLLARRLAAGNWASPLPGELLILDGTASQFLAEIVDDELRGRAQRLDVHPSGVLWGSGRLASQAEAAAVEGQLPVDEPALCDGLQRAGVRMARRALRVRLGAPSLRRHEDALILDFELPRGAFATSVLRELMAHSSL